jgi:hypothetical protein
MKSKPKTAHPRAYQASLVYTKPVPLSQDAESCPYMLVPPMVGIPPTTAQWTSLGFMPLLPRGGKKESDADSK